MPKKSNILAGGVSSFYTMEHLTAIREHPHILGWIMGYDKLTELHSKWIRWIWDTTESRGLQAHRGSYKSTAVAAVGSVWWLLFHPDDRIAIIRKTFTDAAEVVSSVAKAMEMPEVRELFLFAHGEYPEFRIYRREKLEFSFKKTNTPEGSIEPKGLDAGLTGKHYDRILMDDITTLKDRVSRAARENTKEIYQEIATNIIDPGKPVSLIGTPWHKEDVWASWATSGYKMKKFSIYDCNVLTREQVELKRKTTTPSLFAANYELVHVAAEDALFADATWDDWRTTGIESPRAQIDAAFGGEDACALTIMARRNDGFVQAVGYLYRGNIKDWLNVVASLLKQHKCKKIYCEENADKGWTVSMLKQMGFSTIGYQENTQKQYKVATFLYEVWPKILWDKDTEDEYMSQIQDWTPLSKEQDDAPDSAASLCRQCYSKKGAHSERWKM